MRALHRTRQVVAGSLAALASLGPAHPQEASPPEPTFPGQVELVTVDVVVLEKGQPVRGLTRDDFVVLEDGRPQPIESFEFVEVPEAAEPPAPAARPRVSATAPATKAPPERSFVIVFDNVHLSPVQADQAKESVAEFVKTGLREGDRVQFLPTGGGAWWTARMNAGQADLLAALERVEGLRILPTGPERMTDYEAQRIYVFRDKRVSAEVMRRWAENGVIQEFYNQNAEDGGEFYKDLRDEHALLRARAADVYKQAITRQRVTTRALERVMDGLASVRGRKTVLLVTEGFVHDTQEGSFAEVVNAARRANAAVYFLDARLALGGEMAAAELGRAAVLAGGISARDRDIDTPLDQQARGATGAVSIAIDTGGDRLGTAASLADNLRRVAAESRAYYLLGYTPANPARDGRFREIKVRTSRPGLTVRARRGYYAPRDGAAAAVEPGTLDADVQRALDSPFGGSAIPLRLASYVLGPADGDKAKVLVVAEADPRHIRLEARDGRDTGALEAFFLVSSRSGESYHHASRLDLSLPPEARAQVEKTWLPVRHAFELPAGVYQVRSVVRDASTKQMGSLIHEFEVEDPKRLRVTTPVLTDALVPGDGDPRPALLARRTFAAGGRLYGQFEVYGAQPDPVTGQPRVSAGHVLKRADGTILSRLEPTPMPANPQGQITRMLAISLRTAAQGHHELVLTVRDDVANTQVELTEPFEVQGTVPAAAASTPMLPPAAPALKVTQDVAGYRELVSSYVSRPGDAALALARWPAGTRKGAARAFRKDVAEPSRLLAAALLHTEAAFAQPGREKDDLEAARGFLEQVEDAKERQDLLVRWLVAVGIRLQNESRPEASRFLEEALKLRPQDAGAHLALGALQEMLSTLGLVSQRSESSVFGPTGPPVGSESLEKFQAFAEREKRVLDAQEHLRAALAAQPDLLEARLRLGRLASYLGREGEALEQLTPVASASASKEMQHLAQLFLGRVHEQAGRVPVAIGCYRKALELDPTSQAAAIGLSYALGRSGERGPAAEVLRPALRARRTSNAWIAYHLGFPSNYDAALRSLREKVRP